VNKRFNLLFVADRGWTVLISWLIAVGLNKGWSVVLKVLLKPRVLDLLDRKSLFVQDSWDWPWFLWVFDKLLLRSNRFRIWELRSFWNCNLISPNLPTPSLVFWFNLLFLIYFSWFIHSTYKLLNTIRGWRLLHWGFPFSTWKLRLANLRMKSAFFKSRVWSLLLSKFDFRVSGFIPKLVSVLNTHL